MFDPAQLTLGQVSSALRDFAIVGVLIGGAWKSRGWFEHAKQFFIKLVAILERLTTHMDVMEEGMKTLLTNHLTHIESDLKVIASRKEVDG